MKFDALATVASFALFQLIEAKGVPGPCQIVFTGGQKQCYLESRNRLECLGAAKYMKKELDVVIKAFFWVATTVYQVAKKV